MYTFNHQHIYQELSRNREVFLNLLDNIPEPLIYWKSGPDRWNLLEIICHLIDEECEDFRARTDHVLHRPEEPMPGIDPEGWVINRKYVEQDFRAKLSEFARERDNSLRWLQSLENPNWDNVYQHARLGEMSARQYLANWLAHDYLHIRQISRNKYEYLQQMSGQDISYAGRWV